MKDIWLITGGGRSGKSDYAEQLASEKSAAESVMGPGGKPGVLYIATGVATDDEMAERIAHHRASRPETWVTWERYRDIADIKQKFNPDTFGTILLDCVGNLLMGILYEEIPDTDGFTSAQFENVEVMSILELDALCAYAAGHEKRLIIVTNEIGMGVIPETRYSRYYRDALGRINKHAAQAADRVVLMVAGIPVTLK